MGNPLHHPQGPALPGACTAAATPELLLLFVLFIICPPAGVRPAMGGTRAWVPGLEPGRRPSDSGASRPRARRSGAAWTDARRPGGACVLSASLSFSLARSASGVKVLGVPASPHAETTSRGAQGGDGHRPRPRRGSPTPLPPPPPRRTGGNFSSPPSKLLQAEWGFHTPEAPLFFMHPLFSPLRFAAPSLGPRVSLCTLPSPPPHPFSLALLRIFYLFIFGLKGFMKSKIFCTFKKFLFFF